LLDTEDARKQLKDDFSELNDKLIGIEEELYESKNIQLELLEESKEIEAENVELQEKIQQMLDINEQLEKG
jgi:hypothetical protein